MHADNKFRPSNQLWANIFCTVLCIFVFVSTPFKAVATYLALNKAMITALSAMGVKRLL